MRALTQAKWVPLVPALALALMLAASWPGTARAQDVLPVPELKARVIDQTGTLQADQAAALEAKPAALSLIHICRCRPAI